MTTSDDSTRARWLLAGQDLLRRGGVVAVKLASLTESLGLSTGSFYHHFDGMAVYLDDLARFYGADQVEASLAEIAPLPPRPRLRALMAIATEQRMVSLDAAMRDWAGSNLLAGDAVRAADAHLLRFIADTFIDLGVEAAQAEVRALLLFAVGVARVTPPWPPSSTIVDDILDVVVP